MKSRGGLFYFNKYGEDMNFTEELRKMGIKLWADTNLVIKHLGQKAQVDDQTFLKYAQLKDNSEVK